MGKNKENMHVYCLFLLGMEIRTSDVDQKIKTMVKMEQGFTGSKIILRHQEFYFELSNFGGN